MFTRSHLQEMKRRYASMYAPPVEEEVIEDGTIEGVDQYKKDTPGQEVDEHKGTKPHKHPHEPDEFPGEDPNAPAEEEEDEVEEGLEDSPNSANKQHLCAKNVVHEEWGSGQCIATQHADPDEEGNVAWYDVMFEHGIEKGVLITELKVTKSEGHMHASYNGKKKKKE